MGGFFGMLKENKYIQKGWEFNPREELRKKQTNSCVSRSPWRAGSARFAQWHQKHHKALQAFCRAVLWSSQSRAWLSWEPEQPDPGCAATAGGAEPRLWQVTPTPAAPTGLCLCSCSLSGRLFLPFSPQPLNSFPLWPLQNTPSYPREF